jgi:hypothetical protein
MTVETAVPRSRRTLLVGALGGLVGLLGGRLATPSTATAAAGSNLIIGSQTNNAGTSDTQLTTNSSVIAFKLLQNGHGTGLMGYATAPDGTTRGVYGRTDSPDGDGVQARNGGNSGAGAAIRAIGGNNPGVVATSNGYGVYASGSTGVFGSGDTGVSALGNMYGVYGSATSYGVVGSGTSYGGYFFGNVHVSGTLSKSAGAFRIDHPLDPANSYLQHSFVESPEMKNVYDGVAMLDDSGEATVELPAWFDALNSDTRIQLTPVGQHSPLYARGDAAEARFAIAGGAPHQRVFWQVTGVRRDAYAASHRIQVEVPKASAERGRYLHPELFGAHETERIGPRPIQVNA